MNQTIESAPLTNLTQLRDELDWQENRQRLANAAAAADGEWKLRQRRRVARNILGYALAAATVLFVYLLKIGGG